MPSKITPEQVTKVQEIREALARAYFSGCFPSISDLYKWEELETSLPEFEAIKTSCYAFADSLLRNTPLRELCLKGELLTPEASIEAQHDADSVTIKDVIEEVK